MNIRFLKLRDARFGNQWAEEVLDRWDYDDFLAAPDWRRGWISMDCALYHPADDRVYLGITSFDADIFRAYDRRTETFVDLGYGKIADRFDAKFHRSLVRGRDGCLYGAVALLHDMDRYLEAPGGAIVRYDPASGAIAKLGILQPHLYIQSIALDAARDRIYCLCAPPEKLLSFHIPSGTVRDYGLIGTGGGGFAQGENIVLDDAGGVWCGWQVLRAWQSGPGVDAARLCKIDPELDRLVFFRAGLPRPDGKPGTARVEGLFNFHDGWLYASGPNGALYRIDPATARATHLFTPIPERPSRLAAMVAAADGCAYGVTGRAGRCELVRFDFRGDRYDLLGPIVNADGEPCWQVHDIVVTGDGTFYACENDNPHRSGYLWEIKL